MIFRATKFMSRWEPASEAAITDVVQQLDGWLAEERPDQVQHSLAVIERFELFQAIISVIYVQRVYEPISTMRRNPAHEGRIYSSAILEPLDIR